MLSLHLLLSRSAHGSITVPDPSIGNMSTNPINNAIKNGYSTFKTKNLNRYKPTSVLLQMILV